MAIRYSIIIPTYNRAQQLLLTLVSFETQTYPKHLFEVIVADDGSTDGTKEMVEGFQASYPIKYVTHQEQLGRSAVRNLGLRHASGLYIIFCDADFLVLPEFIRTVSRYHRKYPMAVISGIPYSWDDAYTHYYPDFSPEEKEHFRYRLTQTNLWNMDFESANEIIPLITPEDILHQTGALSKVVIPSRVPPNIKKQFAKTDVAPWTLLVTRCVSMRRSHLTRIGGFNERFVLYGLEDWDLGYRLHRLKIPFYSIKEVVGYHQEHPTHFRGNVINTENLKIMFETYGFNDSSLNLFALVPPSEDFETYKNTLRVLRRGIRSKLTRSSALLLRRTLQLTAKHFYQQNNTQAYKRSLQWIKKKAKNRKSRVARVLRKMLLKSEKQVE
ncbi:glycosyltransferase family 2 protein [Paenibacillus aceris]|uniref:Glycosyltransferase involved in cell wall biosynthesis n=1 Tax=Paenibacillus aceris TaxID=869555 RepID=A0ABS4HY72_9BACL|nr:glycosyltransferase family 2 protein [Paenibacillus aceris]MBP1963156.1 glycosyltransferase involved in cell wall biosynthesis [Paenibacillus aceris]NHW38726.1 glycosyltransferase [Paenibacillus aceris]